MKVLVQEIEATSLRLGVDWNGEPPFAQPSFLLESWQVPLIVAPPTPKIYMPREKKLVVPRWAWQDNVLVQSTMDLDEHLALSVENGLLRSKVKKHWWIGIDWGTSRDIERLEAEIRGLW